MSAVDVLFVVDNSGSVGLAQAAMGPALRSFVDQLEASGFDYRIGFTTTDAGNPWCPGTSPENGALVSTACTQRSTQFTNQTGALNQYNEACAANCALTSLGMGNPWMEKITGAYNFTGSPQDVAACLVPQGINGCGFESPLEAMSLALTRSENSADPSFGFIRNDANLAVVFMTDEVDCSAADTSIFEQTSNKVFWSDQSASFPTSAVCWNAGTRCTPDGAGYSCAPADYDVNGTELAAGSAGAVLYSVLKYSDQLETLRASKQESNPNADVFVAAIAGYTSGGGLSYQDGGDAIFLNDFGVGASCTGGGVTAVPPVRLHRIQEDFGSSMVSSVCSLDYASALSGWAATVTGQ